MSLFLVKVQGAFRRSYPVEADTSEQASDNAVAAFETEHPECSNPEVYSIAVLEETTTWEGEGGR